MDGKARRNRKVGSEWLYLISGTGWELSLCNWHFRSLAKEGKSFNCDKILIKWNFFPSAVTSEWRCWRLARDFIMWKCCITTNCFSLSSPFEFIKVKISLFLLTWRSFEIDPPQHHHRQRLSIAFVYYYITCELAMLHIPTLWDFILRMHRRTFKIAVTIMFRTKNDTTIKQHGRFYLRSMTLLIVFSHSTRDDPEHEKAPILRLTLKTSWNFFSIFNSFFIKKSFSISTFEFFGSEKRPASDLKTRSMPCGLTFQKRGNSFNIFIETFEWCQLSDPSSGKVQRNQL